MKPTFACRGGPVKSLKILIAAPADSVAYSWCRDPPALMEVDVMANTCAACDCELDANLIEVTVGGKSVEVCCEECARRLKEAHAGASTPRQKV